MTKLSQQYKNWTTQLSVLSNILENTLAWTYIPKFLQQVTVSTTIVSTETQCCWSNLRHFMEWDFVIPIRAPVPMKLASHP